MKLFESRNDVRPTTKAENEPSRNLLRRLALTFGVQKVSRPIIIKVC